MKCALVLSGHMRYYEKTFDSLKKFVLDPLQPDIFIHTWNNRGNQIPNSGYTVERSEILDVDDVIARYQPKRIEVENFEEVLPTVRSDYRKVSVVPVANIVNMYRKIYLADQLRLQEETEYDFVIKARPDILFESEIPENEIANLEKTVYVPDTGNLQINDHVGFGNHTTMTHYSSVYEKIDEYYDPEVSRVAQTTIKGCGVHAETLLNYHLRKSNLTIVETKLRYHIPHKRS